VGVDVFFVISGFLITTHLLESLETHGRIRFASFYAKRARRILPASLLVAALTVLAAWLWMPPLLMTQVFEGAVATALYVPNILFAVEGTEYLAETSPSVFQHYWSLGIEEQLPVLACDPGGRLLAGPAQRASAAVRGRGAHPRLVHRVRGLDGHLAVVDLLLPADQGLGARGGGIDRVPDAHGGAMAAATGCRPAGLGGPGGADRRRRAVRRVDPVPQVHRCAPAAVGRAAHRGEGPPGAHAHH